MSRSMISETGASWRSDCERVRKLDECAWADGSSLLRRPIGALGARQQAAQAAGVSSVERKSWPSQGLGKNWCGVRQGVPQHVEARCGRSAECARPRDRAPALCAAAWRRSSCPCWRHQHHFHRLSAPSFERRVPVVAKHSCQPLSARPPQHPLHAAQDELVIVDDKMRRGAVTSPVGVVKRGVR